MMKVAPLDLERVAGKISKGALVMARGFKTGTLYTLRVATRKSNVAIVEK